MPYDVTVKDLSNKSQCTLTIERYTTIKELRELLNQESQYPLTKYFLHFAGAALEDHYTAATYNIVNASVLNVASKNTPYHNVQEILIVKPRSTLLPNAGEDILLAERENFNEAMESIIMPNVLGEIIWSYVGNCLYEVLQVIPEDFAFPTDNNMVYFDRLISVELVRHLTNTLHSAQHRLPLLRIGYVLQIYALIDHFSFQLRKELEQIPEGEKRYASLALPRFFMEMCIKDNADKLTFMSFILNRVEEHINLWSTETPAPSLAGLKDLVHQARTSLRDSFSSSRRETTAENTSSITAEIRELIPSTQTRHAFFPSETPISQTLLVANQAAKSATI